MGNLSSIMVYLTNIRAGSHSHRRLHRLFAWLIEAALLTDLKTRQDENKSNPCPCPVPVPAQSPTFDWFILNAGELILVPQASGLAPRADCSFSFCLDFMLRQTNNNVMFFPATAPCFGAHRSPKPLSRKAGWWTGAALARIQRSGHGHCA